MVEFDARAALAGLEDAASRPEDPVGSVDVAQLARDIAFAESEFRTAGELLSGERAAEEGRERSLADFVQGAGLGVFAAASVTPFGTLGKAGRALSAFSRLEDVVDAGVAAERASGAVRGRRGGDLVTEAVLDWRDLQWEIPGQTAVPGAWANNPTAELVPTGWLGQFAEFERSGQRVDELASDISARGFDDPLILEVGLNGRASLIEGNHRLAAAQRLGLGSVPVRVVTARNVTRATGGDAAPVVLREGVGSGKLLKPSEAVENIPSAIDDLTRSVLEFQRSAGMSLEESLEAVNRTRRQQGLEEITPLVAFDEQYPANIGRALGEPQYFEGRPPAGTVQAEVNERIIKGSLDLQADPLAANRLFGSELSRELDEILPVEDLIDDYATFSAPEYAPLRLSSTRVVDKDRGVLDVDPLDTPLKRLGLEINRDFLNSERALAFYARQYKNATRKREKLSARTRFVDEIARTLSNQGRFMTRNSRGKPVFYVERQNAVDNIAARTGINRNVIAGASASASQQAPPMEEAFRLFMAAPFIKIQNGEAVFDTAGFREMFKWGDVKKVQAARAGRGDFPRNKKGEYKIQEFIESAGQSLADLINNPDFLNRPVRGIAHKTSPYAILALDGLNPYAVVADTNYWYVISGNKALNKKVLTRQGLKDFAEGRAPGPGGAQNIPGPMSAGLQGSVMPAAQTRALSAAAGPLSTPSSVQADIWFPLRNILNGAQDDAFFMPGETGSAVRTSLVNVLETRLVGNNAAARRYQKALRELLDGGGSSWEDMMVAALNNLGSAAGPRTTERLRDMAAASYARLGDEVGAGTDMWTRTVRNGEDVLIANPANWRATLAYGDRYTEKGNIVKGVDAAERITERIAETLVPFLRGASGPAAFALVYNAARNFGLSDADAERTAEEIAGEYGA